MAKNLIYYESIDKTFNFHHSIGLIEGDEKFYSKLHKHNCYEILYVMAGSVEHYIEGERYLLTKGNVLIINYNELHMLSDVSDDYERIVIHLSRDFVTPFLTLGVDLFQSFKARIQGHNNVLTPEVVDKYNFKNSFMRIEKLCKENSPENEILTKCLMVEMLITLNKVHSIGDTSSATESNSAVKEVIKYINNNLTSKLTLDKITSKLFVTKTYLCHIFKKKTGISIIQYITHKRILLADELIANGMPATQACLKSGFVNYSNFYKSYTKIMGHSPTGKVNNQINRKNKAKINVNKNKLLQENQLL